MNSKDLSEIIVRGMHEKKAEDIVLMDLRNVKNAVADFFVICSGNSDSQIQAISESIENEVYKGIQENPWHKEGLIQKERESELLTSKKKKDNKNKHFFIAVKRYSVILFLITNSNQL